MRWKRSTFPMIFGAEWAGEAHGGAGGVESFLPGVGSSGDAVVGGRFAHGDGEGGVERFDSMPKGDGGGE